LVRDREGRRAPRSIAGGLAFVVLVTTTLVGAGEVAVAAPSAPAAGASAASATATQQSGNSCDATVSLASAPPFLLPPWADGAGWSAPAQYETIMSGDLDGDGTAELMGRNGANLEVHQWAPNYLPPSFPLPPGGTANPEKWIEQNDEPGSTILPRPHQWAATLATGPAFPEAPTSTDPNGWYDPTFYETFQMADLDGDGRKEVVVRYASGIQVYAVTNTPITNPVDPFAPEYDWTSFAGPPMSDAGSWYLPQYYETITHGDVDGQPGDEIVARGGYGIQVWKLGAGNTFTQIATGGTPILTDAQGWNGYNPPYYQTIQLADVNGDGRAEVLALGAGMQGSPDGLNAWSYDPSTDSWSLLAGGPIPWTPQGGWNNASQYETIQTANLRGRGASGRPTPREVIGRSAQGLQVWAYTGTSWSQQTSSSLLPNNDTSTSPATNFTQAPYYSTIQVADVQGRGADQILARKTDGLHVITYDPASQTLSDAGTTLAQFSDANGWNNEVRYPTIATVDVYPDRPDAPALVIGRDRTGLRTYRLDATTGAWANPSTAFPTWSNATWPADLPNYPASPYAPAFPDTPPGRAYGSVNDWMASDAVYPNGGGMGFASGTVTEPGTTIISSYLDLNTNLGQMAGNLQAILGDDPPLTPQGLNVTRGTWTGVNQDLLYWTEKVQQVNDVLGVGAVGTNVQTLLNDSMITQVQGAYSVSSIQNYFDKNSGFLALFLSLLGGAIAGSSGFAPLTTDVAKARATFMASIAGSAVSGSSAFANPNGSVQSEASKLENDIVSNFCQAIQFLNNAQTQIVQDAGLLATVGQLSNAGGPLSFTGNQYANAMGMLTQQRAIWIFQQFATASNHGWQAGNCPAYKTHGCGVGFGNHAGYAFGNTWVYQAIPNDCCGTPNCAALNTVSGWSLLTDPSSYDQTTGAVQAGSGIGLGVDINTMYGPRVPPNRGDANYGGPAANPIGLSGWQLKTHTCGQ
jgi:hypothetical protein